MQAVLRLDVGGMERVVLDLCRTAVEQGSKVTLLCLDKPGELSRQALDTGAKVISLGKSEGVDSAMRTCTASLIAEIRPDIIHTHQIGVLWYVGDGAREAGHIPVVHTEHIDNVAKAKGHYRKFRARALWHLAGRNADLFCCVSNDIARSAARWHTVPKAKIDVVTNGIDTGRYSKQHCGDEIRSSLGIPLDAPVIGSVARLDEVKRQDLLIHAVAKLGKEHDDVQLLLVGDGAWRRRLEELAAELNIASRVHFAGYQDRTERYLAALDIFALTSRLEGLPLVLLEAGAVGLPVVSSAVGGIPQALENGKTGVLFPQGDLSALVRALRELLAHPIERARMSDAWHRVVLEKYSLERMAKEYRRRYCELLDDQRGRAGGSVIKNEILPLH